MPGCKAYLAKSKELPYPTKYVEMLLGEFSHRTLDQDQVENYRGKWREEFFHEFPQEMPIDVEIGTGNGYHFAHQASEVPDRALLGFEIKYKPLIQTVRRALRAGALSNAYGLRYNAFNIDRVFAPEEINNVYIHHPDPWPKKRQWKHRLIQSDFLDRLYGCMKSGSFIEFKTDNLDYFDWSEEVFKASKFDMEFLTRDLHNSLRADGNFITHFEQIFIRKGQPIYYLMVRKG